MKVNKLFFCTLVSLLTVQSMSPDFIVKHLQGRMPANEAETAAVKIEDKKDDPKNSEVVTCKAESKGEKLEADMKKILDDKEEILKKINGLTKENEELKLKVASSSEKEKKQPEVIALMGQLTSLFSAQMQYQMQMQMQNQMMNMFSQMQTNMVPQIDAYQPSPWSAYSNPYTIMPKMERQQLSWPSDFGFDFSQPTTTTLQPIQVGTIQRVAI